MSSKLLLRAPRRKSTPTYKVHYITPAGTGNMISYEFDGTYKVAASGDFEFEPDWFADKASEDYYDQNWETIEEEISTAFTNPKSFE